MTVLSGVGSDGRNVFELFGELLLKRVKGPETKILTRLGYRASVRSRRLGIEETLPK
jgi:hypothetical protein